MMIGDERWPRLPCPSLLAMLVAAGLALWLLWQPELLGGLPLILRLPLIALGVWALGGGFVQGLALALPTWLETATRLRWTVAAQGAFILVVVGRAWWL